MRSGNRVIEYNNHIIKQNLSDGSYAIFTASGKLEIRTSCDVIMSDDMMRERIDRWIAVKEEADRLL